MRSSLTLKLGDRVTGVKVRLVEGAATLSGQVESSDNQPLPEGLFVYLVPPEEEKSDDVLRYAAARVERDGSFSLDQMAPGRYWIIPKVATDNLEGTMIRLPDGNVTRTKLRREAESAKFEFELKPCKNADRYRLRFK